MTERIAVLGAGAWGTTLACMLAAAGHPVTLWAHRPEAADEMRRDRENSHYLAEHAFPPGLLVTGDAAELVVAHRLYVLAVPSAHVRATLHRLSGHLALHVPFLSVVKGIEAGTQARMSEVITEEMPGRGVAVLSGPNLADEIASGRPAGIGGGLDRRGARGGGGGPASDRIGSGSTPTLTSSAWSSAGP